MTAAPADIEVVNADFPRGPFRAAIFDFDGTLSLLRRNWQDVMIPMMVDLLAATGTTETRDQLGVVVEDFVMRLNGRQTIYQMMQLCEELQARGASPLTPLEYKHQYHDKLWRQVEQRVNSARQHADARAQMIVPAADQFLQDVQSAGVEMYLASGTDLVYVRDEVEVLGLAAFFGARVYGALDDYQNFSKAMIIEQITRDAGVPGAALLGAGDGYVEIEEIKKVGGLAIGVASDEEARTGINDWKRHRLIAAGADIIIGDFGCHAELCQLIGLA
ncbi:MAG: HAD family hydrolase [Planctomycetota bacterium]|nr:HAD family hydrolase [Planctomycetota bacterium]